MATIQSLGQLVDLQPGWMPGINRTSLRFYDTFNYDYATLYRTQSNVRTCVDFLARNVAQLGLHVFRRVSDTDRERLNDHGLAIRLANPLPPRAKMTRYRLFEALMSDMGIYFNAYWLKLRDGNRISGLLRLPPPYVFVEGGLAPTSYELRLGGSPVKLPPEEVVHFRGFNPENPISGLSPLETLRRVLAEEHAAGEYRESFWQNAARMGGIVKRPATAPEWSDNARNRFRQEFEELYSGGANSGKTAVLEEGMEWQQATFSAQESEYLAGRKLTREECARAYHIPLPMVGILDHATLTNIREQHQNLYQDSLGPPLKMIQEDIDLQLLPEFEDSDGLYVEFNLMEKLKGDFEEQVRTLQSAVGRPWMTADEARARMNMPSMGGDAALLVTPLNVIIGGQASPRDSAPPPKSGQKRFDSHAPALRERHEAKWREVLGRHYRRQEASIIGRVPTAVGASNGKGDIGGGVWWDEDRWDSELAADLLRLNSLTATDWAKLMLAQAGLDIGDPDVFSEARMLPWLKEHSRIQAENINGQTQGALVEALATADPLAAVKDVFMLAATVWTLRQAVSAVTSASNFGAHEAAGAGGLKRKTWRTNSGNPRPSHQALNGTSVGIRENFPNGMRWPGDPAGGAEEVANCHCSVYFH